MDQKTAKADELFFVVDENNQPIDPLPRKLVHGHGVWHRVAHIWIINDENKILCQQRSLTKENNPGLWEGFFGGHIGPNEEYADAAQRELEEELGIELDASEFKLYSINTFNDPAGSNNEFQAIFLVRWNGDETQLEFKDAEVERTAWKDIKTIQEKLEQRSKDWTYCGYELELLNSLEHHTPAYL
jgi:16S rRNA (adenine1518-N6/adenine1519-N6)-dimethyltransferase